jgi:hypothetical protein
LEPIEWIKSQQAVEKRPSAAFPSSFPVSKHGAGLLQRTFKYASLLRISAALHLGIFNQPEKNEFFNRLPSFNKAETLSIHYIHTDWV